MIKASTDNLESSMASVMAMLPVAPSQADFAEVLAKINELAGEWKHTTSLLNTINSLSFESINARWVAVEPAYSKTFEWAFHDKVDSNIVFPSLGKWLQSGSDIFWVTGEPGSGKSTFMKYV
jgi:predicted NACHT family NTPase